MKTIKNNSSRTIINILLVGVLLNFSCAEAEKKSNDTSNNGTKSKVLVEAPSLDIQAAILSNNIEVVKQHIEAGTDINKKDAMSGSTPLITAASFGKNDIAKALISAGADLGLKNNDGATALHVAAFFCRVEIVQLLIDAGADKDLKNNFGATARESVMGPFEDMKPFYEMLQQQLAPMGMQLELAEIEKTRPVIAIMLQ
jgi:hypothetical protein